MAKDIILKNQVWEDVPAVDLPIDGGGKQRFTDVSGTTATPSDVASGKLFFDSTGTQQTGTSSGGGANLQTKTATYTPTTSQQTDTIRPDTGYDGLSLVNVIVNAMQGGVDMPTFTLSGIQEGSTVTCDKTYAECLAFYNNGLKVAVAVTTSYGKLPVLVYEVGSDYIKYIAYFQDGSPLGDITLTANSVSYTATSVIEKTPNKPVARKSTVTDNAMKVNVAVTNYKGFYPSGLVTGDPIYVSASEVVSGTKSISANGTGIDVTNYASVDVSVPSGGATLQSKSKSYTPSETAQSETVTADSGYDGLDEVNVSVGAIPSNYVGSGITRRDDDDMSGTVDDPYYIVSAQSGYYPNSAEFGIPLMTLPSTADSSFSGTRKANILPSTSQRYLNIPSGYNPTAQFYQLIGAELLPLNVTQNGTYNPADADVFGFGPVTVDVQGGASNLVEGTFTTGSSTGYTNINIPYTGSGYPIMCVVVIDGGAYHSGTSWYTSTQRYAIGQWTMTKSNMTASPSYTTSGAQNQGVTTWVFKNSTSSSTSYSRSSAMNTNVYTTSNASNSGANTIKLHSGNVLSYYVNTSSYGLHPNMTYRYFIVYSE